MADFAQSSLSGLRSRFGGVGWLRRLKKILVRSNTPLCHHAMGDLSPIHSDQMCDSLKFLTTRQNF
jgi:hypothetical protein